MLFVDLAIVAGIAINTHAECSLTAFREVGDCNSRGPHFYLYTIYIQDVDQLGDRQSGGLEAAGAGPAILTIHQKEIASLGGWRPGLQNSPR